MIIANDDNVEESEVTEYQLNFLISLLSTSSYGKDDTGERMEKQILSGLSKIEFDAIKKDLEQNQIEPIGAGFNYNQNDIRKKLRREI